MTEHESTLAERAMQVVREMASACHLTEDETSDAISNAWEFAQAGRGFPESVAWYAIKRVRSARRFKGNSVRSIGSPQHRPDKPTRWEVDLRNFADPGCDPAESVPIKIDFEHWLTTLSDRLREIAETLANGIQTGALAEQLGVTPARVSQLRRKLEDDWREFQG